jgi:hypothetical protein
MVTPDDLLDRLEALPSAERPGLLRALDRGAQHALLTVALETLAAGVPRVNFGPALQSRLSHRLAGFRGGLEADRCKKLRTLVLNAPSAAAELHDWLAENGGVGVAR